MARLLRYVLLAAAGAALAMLFEPFWSALLLGIGIDTSKLAPLARELLTMSWFAPLAYALLGAAGGVWLHHVLRRIDANTAGDGLVEAMRKTHGNFRKMEDALNIGMVPATIPQWEERLEYINSVLLTFEKAGYRVQWLDTNTDPVGYVYRNARFYNRIYPLVEHGHRKEARAAAKTLTTQLEGEHPGINGRKALQQKRSGKSATASVVV